MDCPDRTDNCPVPCDQIVSDGELAQIMECRLERAKKWCAPLNSAMAAYDITTPDRAAAFLAQVGHESGGLLYVRELWGPTDAQKRYEGREDLGNTEPGDGFRYRGRGLIQITGRANYQQVSDALGLDFVTHPEELELPAFAALSAAWFWNSRDLNALADRGDFRSITRKINGGFNGYDDRVRRMKIAIEVLGEEA